MKTRFIGTDSYKQDTNPRLFLERVEEVNQTLDTIYTGSVSTIYGVSGSGKSSLINCGLKNKLEGGDYYPIVISLVKLQAAAKSIWDNSALTKLSNAENFYYHLGEVTFKKILLDELLHQERLANSEQLSYSVDQNLDISPIHLSDISGLNLSVFTDPTEKKLLIILDQFENLYHTNWIVSCSKADTDRSVKSDEDRDYGAITTQFQKGFLDQIYYLTNPSLRDKRWSKTARNKRLSPPSFIVAITEPELGKLDYLYSRVPYASGAQIRISPLGRSSARSVIKSLSEDQGLLDDSIVDTQPFELPYKTVTLMLDHSLGETAFDVSPFFLQLYGKWIELEGKRDTDGKTIKFPAIEEDFKNYLKNHYKKILEDVKKISFEGSSETFGDIAVEFARRIFVDILIDDEQATFPRQEKVLTSMSLRSKQSFSVEAKLLVLEHFVANKILSKVKHGEEGSSEYKITHNKLVPIILDELKSVGSKVVTDRQELEQLRGARLQLDQSLEESKAEVTAIKSEMAKVLDESKAAKNAKLEAEKQRDIQIRKIKVWAGVLLLVPLVFLVITLYSGHAAYDEIIERESSAREKAEDEIEEWGLRLQEAKDEIDARALEIDKEKQGQIDQFDTYVTTFDSAIDFDGKRLDDLPTVSDSLASLELLEQTLDIQSEQLADMKRFASVIDGGKLKVDSDKWFEELSDRNARVELKKQLISENAPKLKTKKLEGGAANPIQYFGKNNFLKSVGAGGINWSSQVKVNCESISSNDGQFEGATNPSILIRQNGKIRIFNPQCVNAVGHFGKSHDQQKVKNHQYLNLRNRGGDYELLGSATSLYDERDLYFLSLSIGEEREFHWGKYEEGKNWAKAFAKKTLTKRISVVKILKVENGAIQAVVGTKDGNLLRMDFLLEPTSKGDDYIVKAWETLEGSITALEYNDKLETESPSLYVGLERTLEKRDPENLLLSSSAYLPNADKALYSLKLSKDADSNVYLQADVSSASFDTAVRVEMPQTPYQKLNLNDLDTGRCLPDGSKETIGVLANVDENKIALGFKDGSVIAEIDVSKAEPALTCVKLKTLSSFRTERLGMIEPSSSGSSIANLLAVGNYKLTDSGGKDRRVPIISGLDEFNESVANSIDSNYKGSVLGNGLHVNDSKIIVTTFEPSVIFVDKNTYSVEQYLGYRVAGSSRHDEYVNAVTFGSKIYIAVRSRPGNSGCVVSLEIASLSSIPREESLCPKEDQPSSNTSIKLVRDYKNAVPNWISIDDSGRYISVVDNGGGVFIFSPQGGGEVSSGNIVQKNYDEPIWKSQFLNINKSWGLLVTLGKNGEIRYLFTNVVNGELTVREMYKGNVPFYKEADKNFTIDMSAECDSAQKCMVAIPVNSEGKKHLFYQELEFGNFTSLSSSLTSATN